MLNRAEFFNHVRNQPFPGALVTGQVRGCNAILDEFERRGLNDFRWLAYMLATAFHETAKTMQPIHELGSRPYFDKYDAGTKLGATLGNTIKGDGYTFRGRGYVQLTGRANYNKMTGIVGADLVGNPDLALTPNIAAAIMFEGMKRGTFTGKKLSDYFNDQLTDWVNARKIINGLDRAETIASYARQFHGALIAANAPAAQPIPDVPAPVPPAPKPKSNAGPAGAVIVAGGSTAAAAHKQGMSTTSVMIAVAVVIALVIGGVVLFRKLKG